MGDWTYNTDHGSFRMKAENKSEAAKALIEEFGLEGELDFTQAMELLDLFVDCADNGDVFDVYLKDSHFEDEIKKALTEVIAPYVEPGSFVVFYGGGTDGCWAIAWDANEEGVVEGFERDLTTVLNPDLKSMLKALDGTELGKRMKEKYGSILGMVP